MLNSRKSLGELLCPGVVTAASVTTRAGLGGFALRSGSERLHLLLMLGWEGDISYLKAWPAAFKVCKRPFKPPSSPSAPRERRTLTPFFSQLLLPEPGTQLRPGKLNPDALQDSGRRENQPDSGRIQFKLHQKVCWISQEPHILQWQPAHDVGRDGGCQRRLGSF